MRSPLHDASRSRQKDTIMHCGSLGFVAQTVGRGCATSIQRLVLAAFAATLPVLTLSLAQLALEAAPAADARCRALATEAGWSAARRRTGW